MNWLAAILLKGRGQWQNPRDTDIGNIMSVWCFDNNKHKEQVMLIGMPGQMMMSLGKLVLRSSHSEGWIKVTHTTFKMFNYPLNVVNTAKKRELIKQKEKDITFKFLTLNKSQKFILPLHFLQEWDCWGKLISLQTAKNIMSCKEYLNFCISFY